jgi:hypothetical protein
MLLLWIGFRLPAPAPECALTAFGGFWLRVRVLCGADRVNQATVDGEPGERQSVADHNFLLTGPSG